MKQLSSERIKKITSKFSRKKVVVFGDIGVDKYTVGRVTRISPEAPIPIVEVFRTELKLGLASNVADNISALGGEVALIGVIGNDSGAQELKKLLKLKGIDPGSLVVDPKRKTTVKERVVAEQQQILRIDHETPKQPDGKILKQAWGKINRALKNADCVIIEDYAKGLVESSICRQLISAAEKKDIPVFVDPNGKSSLQTYYGCTVMTPNTAEAAALSGIRITDKETLCQAGFKLLEDVHAKIVIITRGKDGMSIFLSDKSGPLLIPTFAREVYDVSGAGDTTIATLALSVCAGANIHEAALIANYAAGIVVGKRGTATTDVGEIRDYVDMIAKMRKKKS